MSRCSTTSRRAAPRTSTAGPGSSRDRSSMPTSSTRRSRRPTRSSTSPRRSVFVTSSTTRSDRCAPTRGAPSTCSTRARGIAVGCCSPRRPRSTASRRRVPWREDDDRVLGSTDVARWSYATAKALDEHLALAHARRGPAGHDRAVLQLLRAPPRRAGLWVGGGEVPRPGARGRAPDRARRRHPDAVLHLRRRHGARHVARGAVAGRARASVQPRHRRRDDASTTSPDRHRAHGLLVGDRARDLRGGLRRAVRGPCAPTSRHHAGRAPCSGGSQRCRCATASIARWRGGARHG